MQAKQCLQAMALAAAIAAALWPCKVNADTPISVVVNGAPVSFNGPPPIEQDGTVLVPLRGVFEALGAGVVYDPSTRTISARKGRSFVVLPIGSTSATVNGQQEQLSVPATVTDGSTFIPLRFVAEALGAYVEWQAANSTVAISTGGEPVAEVPAPRSEVHGIVINVSQMADGNNAITLKDGRTIELKPDARLRKNGQPIAIDDITRGDRVVIRTNPDTNYGYAVIVNPVYAHRSGM